MIRKACFLYIMASAAKNGVMTDSQGFPNPIVFPDESPPNNKWIHFRKIKRDSSVIINANRRS